jgi:uncharacterized protein YndB with AHSA1/START domain
MPFEEFTAMKEYTTTVDIRATPEAVWAILTDGLGYARWNPEITRVDGRIALGEKIKAHVVLHGGKVQPVTVRVTELEPMCMVWTGGMPLGLFTGRRTFSLTPRVGVVEFTMQVGFSGLLSGLIAKSLGDRQPDIDALAAGLKKWAERS